MTKVYSSRARDAAIARDIENDRDLACRAEGCPRLWCIDMGNGKLCSAHDRTASTPQLWPQITAELREEDNERALRGPAPKKQPTYSLPIERRREILRGLQKALRAMTRGDPLSGAKSLREREQRGEDLTLAQRQFWRQALRHVEQPTGAHDDRDADLRFADAKAEQERRVRAYAADRGIAL